jgi:hypothetical protein
MENETWVIKVEKIKQLNTNFKNYYYRKAIEDVLRILGVN